MDTQSNDEKWPIREFPQESWPEHLNEMNDPPKQLTMRGVFPQNTIRLCVVGSRAYTQYGEQLVSELIGKLRGYNITIVSGLAYGIDSLAHRAALDAGLSTIVLPGSGLNWDILYPQDNVNLAREVLESGGCLLSEFSRDYHAMPWTFPQRNRIMAGISHATLIIEASEKSGTLITARLAMEYNRDVCAVPGSIFSKHSFGPNKLIQDGAIPICSVDDLLDALHIPRQPVENRELPNLSEEEKELLSLVCGPLSKEALLRDSSITPEQALEILTKLEIKGIVSINKGIIRKN